MTVQKRDLPACLFVAVSTRMPTLSVLKDAIQSLGGAISSKWKKTDFLTALVALPGGPVKLEQLASVKLQTEDLGKIVEKALCNVLCIPYNGAYKYGPPPPELESRLSALKPHLPADLVHTAAAGARYDYTSISDPSKHISVKTTKGGSKIAPSFLGQPQPAAFCERIGIPFVSVPALKCTIQENIATLVLPAMATHTFDAPIVYYNARTQCLQIISLRTPIDWSAYEYSWSCSHADWNNSASVKIRTPTGLTCLAEFQFHSASRTNMANRWCFESVLSLFREHFAIIDL